MNYKTFFFLQPWNEYYKDSSAKNLLFLLISTDFVFFFLHILTKTRYGIPLFSLEIDGSYSEFFNYIKEFWIAVLFFKIYLKTKYIGFLVWSTLFLYLLIDDSLMVHEIVGGTIVNTFNLQDFLGLRAQDLGELAVTAIAGGVLFSLLIPTIIQGDKIFKRICGHIMFFILFLALFGVIVDMLHMIIKGPDLLIFILGMIEDGGEMLVMSVIVSYVFFLNLFYLNLQQSNT